jgi:hypothetical protein
LLTRLTHSILEYLGYRLIRIRKTKQEAPGFVLYAYLKKDGSFDYEKYRQIQEDGNKRKINLVWVIEDNIAFLSTYIKSVVRFPLFGICHGTRRALRVRLPWPCSESNRLAGGVDGRITGERSGP